MRDLLRAVGPDWIADVDLGTLERLSAEHVGDLGQTRRGDTAWRVRFRNGWLHLPIVLEFQSTNDARMALRNLEYTALLLPGARPPQATRPARARPARRAPISPPCRTGRPSCPWSSTTATRRGPRRSRCALLRRLAAVRFGDAVAGRVEDLLRATEDWDGLATAAELIVRAETGPGLIDAIARGDRPSGSFA